MVDDSSHDPEPFFQPTDLTNASSWIWKNDIEKNTHVIFLGEMSITKLQKLKKDSFIQKDMFENQPVFFSFSGPAFHRWELRNKFIVPLGFNLARLLSDCLPSLCFKSKMEEFQELFCQKKGRGWDACVQQLENQSHTIYGECLLAPVVICNWHISGCQELVVPNPQTWRVWFTNQFCCPTRIPYQKCNDASGDCVGEHPIYIESFEVGRFGRTIR